MENKQETIERIQRAAKDGRDIFFNHLSSYEKLYAQARVEEDWRTCHQALALFLTKVNERIKETNKIKKKLSRLNKFLTPQNINRREYYGEIVSLIEEVWYELNVKSQDLLLPSYEQLIEEDESLGDL